MKTCCFLLAMLVACCAPSSEPAASVASDRGKLAQLSRRGTMDVLFIGNSYSFGVPKALRKLSASRGKTVRTAQVTHNGWTLARHAENAETLSMIRGRRWDVVVLQEQSRIPARPLGSALGMTPAVGKLSAEARKQGAVPVLYQTWADETTARRDSGKMTARIREGYSAAAAKAGGLIIVPAGDAWQRAVSQGGGGALYMADGRHPSKAGDALTAEVFYQTLFPDH